MSHSSAEAELYAMTQATVKTLAIKHFIQELKSVTLANDVKITVKTVSSAGKTMARLAISRISKHMELKHLWIQDVLSEGIISIEKVGTHHNPSSDVLTKFVQAAVLGQHLPKFKFFKDPALLQVLEYGLGVEKSRQSSQGRKSSKTKRMVIFTAGVSRDHWHL